MLFSKFKVVQPAGFSLMCPSSMFNSTKQNIHDMNSHPPDLMLWWDRTPHRGQRQGRHKRVTTPWRDKTGRRRSQRKQKRYVNSHLENEQAWEEEVHNPGGIENMQKQGWNKCEPGVGTGPATEAEHCVPDCIGNAWGEVAGNRAGRSEGRS